MVLTSSDAHRDDLQAGVAGAVELVLDPGHLVGDERGQDQQMGTGVIDGVINDLDEVIADVNVVLVEERIDVAQAERVGDRPRHLAVVSVTAGVRDEDPHLRRVELFYGVPSSPSNFRRTRQVRQTPALAPINIFGAPAALPVGQAPSPKLTSWNRICHVNAAARAD